MNTKVMMIGEPDDIELHLSRQRIYTYLTIIAVLAWCLVWLPIVTWMLTDIVMELGFGFWRVFIPFVFGYSIIATYLMLSFYASRGEAKIEKDKLEEEKAEEEEAQRRRGQLPTPSIDN